jgi:hypothetical protein
MPEAFIFASNIFILISLSIILKDFAVSGRSAAQVVLKDVKEKWF